MSDAKGLFPLRLRCAAIVSDSERATYVAVVEMLFKDASDYGSMHTHNPSLDPIYALTQASVAEGQTSSILKVF